MTTPDLTTEARRRIHRRRTFSATLTALLVISPTILAVYWLTGHHPFFWAVYPVLGLLIATGYTANIAFFGLPGDITEYDLRQEERRLTARESGVQADR